MDSNNKETSTYGAVFAGLVLLIIMCIVGYQAVLSVFKEQRALEEYAQKEIIFENIPENEEVELEGNKILYDDLTDEDAERIIKELLERGRENQEKIVQIEREI